MIELDEAQSLLDQIQIFSERYIYAKRLGVYPSRWRSDLKKPLSGVVFHYTNTTELDNPVRWFCLARHEARVSAHYVIGRCREAQHDALSDDLPLVRRLPVTVVQCVPINRKAWHAQAANSSTYGLELVGLGHSPNAGVIATKPNFSGILINGWFSYPPDQLTTTVIITKALAYLTGPFAPFNLLGHSHVQADKVDPGPLFPIERVRLAVSTPGHWSHWSVDQTAFDVPENLLEPILNGEISEARNRPILRYLGYYVDTAEGERETYRWIQRAYNLRVDGILGPLTQEAVRKSIKKDFRLSKAARALQV